MFGGIENDGVDGDDVADSDGDAATATFNADPVGISGWASVGASGWGLAISGFEALGQRAPRHGIRLMAPFL